MLGGLRRIGRAEFVLPILLPHVVRAILLGAHTTLALTGVPARSCEPAGILAYVYF